MIGTILWLGLMIGMVSMCVFVPWLIMSVLGAPTDRNSLPFIKFINALQRLKRLVR
jgi:hypothetical protein